MLTRQDGLNQRPRECDSDQLLEGRDVVKPLNLQDGLDCSNRNLPETTRQARSVGAACSRRDSCHSRRFALAADTWKQTAAHLRMTTKTPHCFWACLHHNLV